MGSIRYRNFIQRALDTGALLRESQRILNKNLPAKQIEGFRNEVRQATITMVGRNLTDDAGFNGSPFYALVRHADPTLYGTIGATTAWFNLILQSLAVLAIAWLLGISLGIGITSRLAMATIVFASWDFVSFAFPGLVFAGLYLPVAIALYYLRRRRFGPAGVAIGWAGLIKLFPFILLLPATVRLIRGGIIQARRKNAGRRSHWFLLVV